MKVRLHAVGPVAVSLSAGLDSGSVAATAARLRDPEQELFALTSVPLWDTTAFVGDWLADEFPLASATADFAGIEMIPIRSASLPPLPPSVSPCGGMASPGHAASDQYWTQEVRREARAHVATTLLNGATGNAGISWEGWPPSQSLQHGP